MHSTLFEIIPYWYSYKWNRNFPYVKIIEHKNLILFSGYIKFKMNSLIVFDAMQIIINLVAYVNLITNFQEHTFISGTIWLPSACDGNLLQP